MTQMNEKESLDRLLAEPMPTGIIPVFDQKSGLWVPGVHVQRGRRVRVRTDPAVVGSYVDRFLRAPIEELEDAVLFPGVSYDPRDWTKKTDYAVGKELLKPMDHATLMAAAQEAKPGTERPLSSGTVQGLVESIYDHRNDARSRAGSEAFLGVVRPVWQRSSLIRGATETVFRPGGFSVTHINPDGTKSTLEGELPYRKKNDQRWAFIKLAPEQAESQLGRQSPVPEEYVSFIESHIGTRRETWGAANQYAAPRHRGNLRRTGIWAALLGRGENDLRCGWVSDVGCDGRFNLYPGDILDNLRPALAGAQKISTGNEGYHRK